MRETRASFSFPFYYCTCSFFKQNLAHKIMIKCNILKRNQILKN